jgi:ACT domain-containing protein
MILTNEAIEYFNTIAARVNQATIGGNQYPYFIEGEDFINKYESIRMVWLEGLPVKSACEKFGISRSLYYECEKNFIKIGTSALFSLPRTAKQFPDIETLALLAKKAKPSLSYTAILRIAQSIPLTKSIDNPKLISKILHSHGYGLSNMEADIKFWDRIQRTLKNLSKMTESKIEGRNIKQRKKTFFNKNDICQKRLELIRYLFYHPESTINQVCSKFGITSATFYRLSTDYKFFVPCAIIPAPSNGKKGMVEGLQLTILLEKLKNPEWTPETLINTLKLEKVSRFAVHRVYNT